MGVMQEAIDRSMAGANDFTRAMFAELEWTADEVISFVNSVRSATIATANVNGAPHAAVVIAACHDEHIYFTVTPSSTMARNLVDRQAMAFSVCYADRSIMGQGRATLVGHAGDLPDLLAGLAASGSSGGFTPPGWDGLIYRIDIRRIFTG
jgi:pyridoxine/pyridoxamine 5'-phosphate oxidase